MTTPENSPANVQAQQDPGIYVPPLGPSRPSVYDPAAVPVGGGNNDLYQNIIPNQPVYLKVLDDGVLVVERASVLNFDGNTFTVTAQGSTAVVSITGAPGLGDWAFSGNIFYNINGGTIDNSDLSHGATAFLKFPTNGSGAQPLQILDYYGNITLTAGLNPSSTQTWTFDRTGNLRLPSDTAVIKYANGSPYGGGGGNTFSSITLTSTPAGAANIIQYGLGNIVGYNDGGWTIGEYNGNSFGTEGIRINPAIEGPADIVLPADAANVAVSVNNYAGNVSIQSSGGTWTFDNAGNLNIPGVIHSTNSVDLYASDAVTINANNSGTTQSWIFDETGNLTVPGTVQGSTSTSLLVSGGQPGIAGSWSITNSQWVTVAASANWALGTNWTIEYFSNATTASSPSDAITVMSQAPDTNLDIYYINGNLCTNNNTVYCAEPTPGVFTHVAIVSTAGVISIYYNGVAQSLATSAGHSLSNAGAIYIGRRGNNNFQYFQGSLTNIRITNKPVYTGNFSTPTSILTATQSSGSNIEAITGTEAQLVLSMTTEVTAYDDTSTWTNAVTNHGTVFEPYSTELATLPGSVQVTAGNYDWTFDADGNLVAPGNVVGPNLFATSNFVGTSLRTNLSEFNWSEFITDITTGITTIITLANNVFGDPWSGQVTISDVTGTTEANGTWWYEATDSNSLGLYTNSSLSTPVDSSAWGAYTGGGFAVTLDYGNIEINAQNITIRSDHGDYSNKIWRFDRTGQTVFPYMDVARGDNPSGNVTGYVMNMGDGTNEAIITTPDGIANVNATSQRLVINPGKGADGTSGEGGDIYLWAGRGGTGDGTTGGGSGGDIKIRGGQGMAQNAGGYIRIEAGDSHNDTGSAGYIEITGGGTTGGSTGYVNITGGPNGNGAGGNVTLAGGYGTTTYGNVQIQSNTNIWTFDNTGALTLPRIYTGPGPSEQLKIVGTREIVGTDGNSSAQLSGTTPALVYTCTSNSVLSAKLTFVVQSYGDTFGWEQFDVSVIQLYPSGVGVTVSNRMNFNPANGDTQVTAALNGAIEIYLAQPSAGTAYVNYVATEFNIMAGG